MVVAAAAAAAAAAVIPPHGTGQMPCPRLKKLKKRLKPAPAATLTSILIVIAPAPVEQSPICPLQPDCHIQGVGVVVIGAVG